MNPAISILMIAKLIVFSFVFSHDILEMIEDSRLPTNEAASVNQNITSNTQRVWDSGHHACLTSQSMATERKTVRFQTSNDTISLTMGDITWIPETIWGKWQSSDIGFGLKWNDHYLPPEYHMVATSKVCENVGIGGGGLELTTEPSIHQQINVSTLVAKSSVVLTEEIEWVYIHQIHVLNFHSDLYLEH